MANALPWRDVAAGRNRLALVIIRLGALPAPEAAQASNSAASRPTWRFIAVQPARVGGSQKRHGVCRPQIRKCNDELVSWTPDARGDFALRVDTDLKSAFDPCGHQTLSFRMASIARKNRIRFSRRSGEQAAKTWPGRQGAVPNYV
jgi:hypothetical protein